MVLDIKYLSFYLYSKLKLSLYTSNSQIILHWAWVSFSAHNYLYLLWLFVDLLIPFKTSFIQFSNTRSEVVGWTDRADRFSRVAKAVKESSLSQSLKTIVVWKTSDCLGKEKAREVLDQHGLTHVQVEEKCYNPNTS